ncbi:MAG: hypothetical protein KTR26_04850 [Flammeovirgaceae bacterium]|nr:hypothetical protein [Flammeovirgaceae bacterium]
MRNIYLAVIISCVVLWGCNSSRGQESAAGQENLKEVSRRDLFRAFRNHKKVLMVYGFEKEVNSDKFVSQIESLRSDAPDISFELKEAKQVSQNDLGKRPLYLVGTVTGNPWIERLIPELSLNTIPEGFEFADKAFTDPSNVFQFSSFPNPFNPNLPISLATGVNEEEILKIISNTSAIFVWNSWGYEIYEKEERIIIGDFSQNPDNKWQVDKAVHIELNSEKVSKYQSIHFNFKSYDATISEEGLEQISQNCEGYLKELTQFTDTGENNEFKINYVIYPSTERKGLMTGNTDQVHIDHVSMEIHAVLNREYKGNYLQMENELVIRKLLGKPELNFMEKGLAIHFTKNWQRQGFRYWGSKLFYSGNLPTISELANPEIFEKESEVVFGCASALLVEFLIEQWGKDNFLNKYKNWNPLSKDLSTLEKNWKKYLSKHYEEPTKPNLDNHHFDFYKGVNFTHEGYQIYNGYISNHAATSLERFKNIGGNAVTIVPYSYMRDPEIPSFFPITNRAGSENDESVIHVAYQAKKLGLATILKPQVWLGRGSWPGDVEMKSEEDWDKFFRYYYCWIRHYALLAEIHGIEMLCIGTEFAKTTQSHDKKWREIIGKIRKLYGGKLVYSANWGEEFENIKFWDELDYIGISCYYPLSDKENASEKELQKGFTKVLNTLEKVAKTHQKPVILTEIGFRSIESPWITPHADAGKQLSNTQHQAKAYEIVFSALEKSDWCKGIFWWKWPSTLEKVNIEDRRFIPTGKEAELVMKKWFQKEGFGH